MEDTWQKRAVNRPTSMPREAVKLAEKAAYQRGYRKGMKRAEPKVSGKVLREDIMLRTNTWNQLAQLDELINYLEEQGVEVEDD